MVTLVTNLLSGVALDHDMFTYPCGTTYYVTLVTAHAQCILVNQKVKECLYMSHEMSSDVCGTSYCVTLVTTHAQYKKT